MLVKGEVEYKCNDFHNCLLTMEAAFEIPGIKDKNMPGSKFNS